MCNSRNCKSLNLSEIKILVINNLTEKLQYCNQLCTHQGMPWPVQSIYSTNLYIVQYIDDTNTYTYAAVYPDMANANSKA